jgi:signal peptidase II
MRDTKTTGAPPAPAPAADPAAGNGGKAAIYLGLAGAIVLLDQVTKVIAQTHLRLYDPVPVIGEYVRLTYIYNPGAAFGIHLGQWSRFGFITLAMLAVGFLYYMYRTTPAGDRLRLIAIGLVTGGAIGNVIDRIRSPRGVIDFLDFGLGATGPRWPVFNVADIGVTCGALLLAASLWREEQALKKEEDATT